MKLSQRTSPIWQNRKIHTQPVHQETASMSRLCRPVLICRQSSNAQATSPSTAHPPLIFCEREKITYKTSAHPKNIKKKLSALNPVLMLMYYNTSNICKITSADLHTTSEARARAVTYPRSSWSTTRSL